MVITWNCFFYIIQTQIIVYLSSPSLNTPGTFKGIVNALSVHPSISPFRFVSNADLLYSLRYESLWCVDASWDGRALHTIIWLL